MFEQLPAIAADPILGLVTAYKADSNPSKVDLCAGVYKNEQGETPIMDAVLQAQARWSEQEQTKAYAPQAGFSGFNEGVLHLLLGDGHPALREQRVASVQTPGGCGALSVAAGMLSRCRDQVNVWVSNPTWANHLPLLKGAGLELKGYPYYDAANHGIDFDGMMSALDGLAAGDLVLLHGCCHNPSGADLTRDQWQAVAELLNQKGATPFVDIAYQGLGDGLEEDAWALRYLAEQCPEMVVASSCSKNFGLYRERVGAVLVIARNSDTANVCLGQLQNVARQIYSMPPSHGAAIVDIILHDDQLTHNWKQELMEVRDRIANLRTTLVSRFNAAGAGDRFDFIQQEKGMFSFLGISKAQVQRLRDEYSIYMVGSSRISVASLNDGNMDYVINAVMDVL